MAARKATRLELQALAKTSSNSTSIIEIIDTLADTFTGIMTFYASSTEGGATNQLNTVEVVSGLIVTWTQESPSAGHPVALIARLSPLGLPGRRCGSFAGR